ncbi:MAG: glycoside hydrolase 43 family protein [Bacteroidaceae bacterium]|nr:glycoside hydrolase 43 family protein [Bacteroidaceae bacterium]
MKPFVFLIALFVSLNSPAQIVHADRSDPDAIRVGDTYYMTTSSFNLSPGLPIYESRDLTHWTLTNYALPRVPNDDFERDGAFPVKHGRCVWAPSIRYHDSTFYIYWGDPDYGIYMTSTQNPRGPWTEPVLVVGGRGMIDPCPLWDDAAGRVYLVHAWAASRAHINSVLCMTELSADGKRAISQPRLVYDGTYDRQRLGNHGSEMTLVNHTVEGPKLYQRDGWYYIFAPAGGVAQGWQLALRSHNIYGPYESRVVLAQGRTDVNGPHQGAWVETAEGDSWFLHFQEKQPYGRILHLQPIVWRDGWPVMGDEGVPTEDESSPHSVRREFAAAGAKVEGFQWHANYEPLFGFATEWGVQRIYSHPQAADEPNLWSVPNLWTQAFPAETFTATARLRIVSKDEANRSGLLVMGWDYCHLALQQRGQQFELVQTVCHDAEQGGQEQTTVVTTLRPDRVVPTGNTTNVERTVWLRVRCEAGGLCHFSYSLDGRKYHSAGQPFQAREGKWIGARIGLCSVTREGTELGWTDCHEFTLEP